MRLRLASLMLLPIIALATLSATRGQNPPPVAPPPPVPGQLALDPPPAVEAKAPERAPLALEGLTDLQKQFVWSTRRATEWLSGMNVDDGRFRLGYLPDLKVELKAEQEGDNYLHQAQAAYALARAARLTGEERYAVRAVQAILVLLEQTTVDNDQRHTTLPSVFVNRVGAAGLLVLAINELPKPTPDLLARSEELCAFLHGRIRADGGVRCSDAADAPADSAEEVNGGIYHAGIALYALARSQRLKPAPWKIEVVTKAAAFYMTGWRASRRMEFVPWHTAAYAEAFLINRDKKLADAVLEMNDWLLGMQYDRLDPRHPLWYGGFASFEKDHRAETMPDAGTATSAESLAQACRVTRQLGDVQRHQRYSDALEHSLQFLTGLQYTDANTQHFAEWYRPRLVGGFYVSHQDGTLRIEHTPRALMALSLYLEYVVR